MLWRISWWRWRRRQAQDWARIDALAPTARAAFAKVEDYIEALLMRVTASW